jgi:hypothetical protein
MNNIFNFKDFDYTVDFIDESGFHITINLDKKETL